MSLWPIIARLRESSADGLCSTIYLDWNSTGPPHQNVIEAMRLTADRAWGNPASVHKRGRHSRNIVESVRDILAQVIGGLPQDVAFTSGGTEANNWALHNAPGLLLSRLEHPSITRQGERLAKLGRPVRWLEVPYSGRIEPDSVERALVGMPPGTCVAMTVVNHETGVVQPIEAIAKPAHRLGAFMHVDAVQALGKLPVIRWNCWDSVAVAAHKIRGPKGIGALAWKCGRPTPTPLLVGGAQERGLRAGTVDPVLIAGFGVALERLVEYSSSIVELAKLRDLLESEMSPSVESNIPVHVERLGHVASLHVRGWSAEELVAALDLEGICVSSGSACAAGTSEASPVIASMLGLERARSTIRISLGETTSESEIRRTIEVFQRVLRRT